MITSKGGNTILSTCLSNELITDRLRDWVTQLETLEPGFKHEHNVFLSQYLNIVTISLPSGFDATNVFRRTVAKIILKNNFIIALNIEHEHYHAHLSANDCVILCMHMTPEVIVNSFRNW